MKCRACEREATGAQRGRSDAKFCAYHAQAYEELKRGYDEWVGAYGAISWKDYLGRLLERKETGSWVLELITLELGSKDAG
jgi:hypothetical protein